MPIRWAPVPLLVFHQEDRGTGAHNMGTCPLAGLTLLSMLNHGFGLEAVHGHERNITWSRRARQEDRGTGAHDMGTCPLARLSLLSMRTHGFVIEAVHGHESNITWSPRARQEDRGTGAHNMGNPS